jgi:hypothetical protein
VWRRWMATIRGTAVRSSTSMKDSAPRWRKDP